jgi:hypothetical protein
MKLSPEERELRGAWVATAAGVVADEVAQRIEALRRGHLVEVASDPSGWDTLYRDPDDGRLWELTYPSSGTHGGGAPCLRQLDAETARARYGPGADD